MKVAVVTSFPRKPEEPYGGVEAVSVNLVRALAARDGCEVHVITADVSVDSPSTSQWAGAMIHRLPRGRAKLLPYILGEGRRQICDFVEQLRPDVVHAHDFYGIVVKGLPLPRVFTIHGFIHEDTRYSGTALAWLRAKLWRRIEVSAWREQPHIISISPYVRQRLSGVVNGCVHDIENPIALECFEVPRAEQAGTIFFAGTICKRKNTMGLVQAFARLAQQGVHARLRLAGPLADNDYVNAVHDFVRHNELADKVVFLGLLSASEIRQELARASVFALVSFEEGAPMGISEAMAAGVPVVTSDRCGMPYMVQHGGTGLLVDPNNVNEIAEALTSLLREHGLGARFGAIAKRAALERYHPDVVAEKTVSVYRQCIAEGPAQASKEMADDQKELAGEPLRT